MSFDPRSASPDPNYHRYVSHHANHAPMLSAAIKEARASFANSGIPIGAVLVNSAGTIVGRGHNLRVQTGDPIAHGEMSCLRNAGRRRDYQSLTMYTTLAPCIMCTGALLLYKIPRVVVGESRTFPGELDLLRANGVEVNVLDAVECIELMREFIGTHPDVWNEDIGIPS